LFRYAVAAAGDAEAKAGAHLDRYYQWTYSQRRGLYQV
jgi:hypothetical protein